MYLFLFTFYFNFIINVQINFLEFYDFGSLLRGLVLHSDWVCVCSRCLFVESKKVV